MLMRNRLVIAALGVILALMAIPTSPEPEVRAGTALMMDVPALVEGSDLVLEGRIIGAVAEESAPGLIETVYTIKTYRILRGQGYRGQVREIRIPGGVLPDGRGMLLSGVSRLEVGEDALLFLSVPGPRALRMPVGLAQGRYRVETRLDGSKIVMRAQNGLGLINPATGEISEAGSLFVHDYAEFIAEIEAAVAARAARTNK